MDAIKQKIKDQGWEYKETRGLPGWQAVGIGKEEGKDDWDYQNGLQWTAKCAVYCEDCNVFIGRWPVPMRYKAWCNRCV